MHPDCPAANETIPASAISAAIPAASRLFFGSENYFHDRFDHLSSISMTTMQYRNPNLVPHENYFGAFCRSHRPETGFASRPLSGKLEAFFEKDFLKEFKSRDVRARAGLRFGRD
jgi:hypothetical protein